MIEFIVVMPRVEGNMEIGYRTEFYSDFKQFTNVDRAISHGMVELDQADDFLIGKLQGHVLLALQYMHEVRDDPSELVRAADCLCLGVKS
ncbi:hypothetical protein [Mycolicibacterium sphagni]|uniref:hypothetical protein n=1 Tax=Mycolicibacterium sphagni TaxID=1786 RepID=UPI0021F354CF|nr:hypothetical protein [Mycolicibacterium sphagni]MCV7174792.1 hypothetical protein [Mycolicibacterium sphagni]